ncbi:MAG: DUF6232 family protein [Dehalococcoidia bacterium]
MADRDDGVISIENNVMVWGHQIFQVANLTSISKYRVRRNNLWLYVLMLLVVGAAVYVPSATEEIAAPIIGAAGVGFLFVLLLVAALLRRKRYAVRIETNSGTGKVGVATDEQIVDAIINELGTVMRSRDYAGKVTINVKNGEKYVTNINAPVTVSNSAGANVGSGRAG